MLKTQTENPERNNEPAKSQNQMSTNQIQNSLGQVVSVLSPKHVITKRFGRKPPGAPAALEVDDSQLLLVQSIDIGRNCLSKQQSPVPINVGSPRDGEGESKMDTT